MSLQTRFTTVLLQPIQPDELMLIIKDKAPSMPDDEARRWCGAFFEAKRNMPTLTTRTLWEALKGTSGCSSDASEIKTTTTIAVAPQQPSPSKKFNMNGGRGRIAVCAAATVVLGEKMFGVQVHRMICLYSLRL